jgi:hypothetical protein
MMVTTKEFHARMYQRNGAAGHEKDSGERRLDPNRTDGSPLPNSLGKSTVYQLTNHGAETSLRTL